MERFFRYLDKVRKHNKLTKTGAYFTIGGIAFLLCIGLDQWWVLSVHGGIPESVGKGDHQSKTLIPHATPLQDETASPLPEEPTNSSSRWQEIDHGNTTRNNTYPSAGPKIAVETEQRIMDTSNSGLKGTTSFIVRSGVPGGQTTGGPSSIEFAIAPIEGDTPAYQKAIFVKSDAQGNYEVALPPGTYWIGPKEKVLDPAHYFPRAVTFPEQVAVVKEGRSTHIDLVVTGHAP
jgi:hypothetical protein